MTDTQKITVYTPESPIRHPLRLLAAMARDIAGARGLAWRLFVRDISATYRQSFLGYIWAFLPPIATTLGFTVMARQGVMNTDGMGVAVPAYIGIGMVFWQTFADAVNSPLKSVTASKGMLTKINFPREALLLAGLGEVAFNFAVRSTLLVVLFLWFQLPVSASVLLAPVGAASLILLGFAVGLILVPFGALARDVGRGVTVAMGFWLLLTPVTYAPRSHGLGALFSNWNPVGPLLTTCREWVLGNPPTMLPQYFMIVGGSLVVLLVGWILFRLAMPIVIERMGG